MELNGASQESLRDVLQAWDTFLLSTEEIEVPPVHVKNLTVATLTLTCDFIGSFLDLLDATTTEELIDKPKLLGDSKPIVENNFEDLSKFVPLIIDFRSFNRVVQFLGLLLMRQLPFFAPPLRKPPDWTYDSIATPPLPPEPPDIATPWHMNRGCQNGFTRS